VILNGNSCAVYSIFSSLKESIIGGPGTPVRNLNHTSDVIETFELPIDNWEMSPDNVVMDQSTFLACGNFGEVYKGKLRTATKSQNETYLADKLVAVKILQGTKMHINVLQRSLEET